MTPFDTNLAFARIALVMIILLGGAAARSQPIKRSSAYPVGEKWNQEDNYFGTLVKDPYRWLENPDLPQTRQWVEQQQEYTLKYLQSLPYQHRIKKHIESTGHIYYQAPHKEGSYYFNFHQTNDKQTASLFYRPTLQSEVQEIVNPAAYRRAPEEVVSIGTYAVSRDSKYLAFSLSRSGSDWREIRVVSLPSGKKQSDVIEDVKFSSIQWQGRGFYYCRYQRPQAGAELTALTIHQKVYYHRLGTSQDADSLIYQAPAGTEPVGIQVTSDERFLLLYTHAGKNSANMVLCLDTQDTTHKMLKPIIAMPPKTNYFFDVIDNIGDSLLVVTDLYAPKRQLLMVYTKGMNRFTLKVPEYKETLEKAYWIGDRLIALYLKDVNYHAVVFDLNGKPVDYIPFPAGASVAGFAGSPQDTSTLVYCYSFTFPPIVFAYDLRQLKLTVFRKTTINYDYKQLETRQVFYSSRDGTRIPMILVHKKGLKRTEDHPTTVWLWGLWNCYDSVF